MRFSEPTIASSCAQRRLQLFLAIDLLALRHLLELRVDLGLLGGLQLQLRQAALVVDRHRRAVEHRALDVVDADVVAEDRARVGVGLLDRRTGEADERRVRKCIAHVPREAVDEVVLAAVGLVGDHDDVAPVREDRVPVALLFREELLDRREDHAARRNCELGAQIAAVRRLHGILAQEVAATREGREELVVEIVAVGEHHDGRILERGMQNQSARVEGHRQALPRTLRVPHDADPPIPGLCVSLGTRGIEAGKRLLADSIALARRTQRLLDGDIDRMELVITGHLLDELAGPFVLEDEEVAQQREEAARLEDALDHHVEFRQMRRCISLARHCAPGLEPFLARADRADPRLHAVRGDQHRVGRKERTDLCLVGLELLERGPDRRVLVGRVLELDHCERQAVDEEHDVRPPSVRRIDHRELIDCEPVIVRRLREVDHTRLRTRDRSVRAPVLDGDPVHQDPVHRAIALGERRRVNSRQLPVRILDRLGRQPRIEPRERRA